MKSGIILINKDSNITSHSLIAKIKDKYNFKKIGHAGTLDPLATGLLVVLFNNATKLSNYLINDDKSYEFTIKLFEKTDTGDITGTQVETRENIVLQKKAITEVIDHFNGFIYDQKPPIYSAIKVAGKKMYEYARKGQKVDIKTRQVTINELKLIEYNAEMGEISLYAKCSKGTYIRSLAEDICARLNTIGTISRLQRLSSGNFNIKDAVTLEEIQEQNFMSIYDALFLNEKTMLVHHNQDEIKQGKPIVIINHSEKFIFILNKDKELLAIYEHIANHVYKSKRGIWTQHLSEKENL